MFGRKNKKPAEQGSLRRQVDRSGGASPAFSYYSSRQPEIGRKRLQPRQEVVPAGKSKAGEHSSLAFSRLPLLLLLTLAIVCAIKVLALGTNPKVIVVGKSKVSASYEQSADVYTAAAQQLLSSSITNRTKLTVNLDGTAQSLQRQFPELQTVSLGVPLIGNRPIVYVQLAQPSVILQSTHGNYALNKTGVVLAKLRSMPSAVPLAVDQSGVVPRLGKQFLPSSTVAFLQTLQYQLDAAHLTVATFVLPKDSPYELDVRLEGKPYTIRCNLEADALTQSGAAIATVQKLGSTVPANYIDVRVPGRVYYK